MAKQILVTGGAGFVGSNLVNSLLGDGFNVLVFDALLRRGSEHNVAWLRHQHRNSQLQVVKGDVRDFEAVRAAVHGVDVIYHLAGQVAVTSSVQDPRTDFEINALGTFNVLEATRLSERRPVILFTSTNKVYGGMEDVAVVESMSRFKYRDFPQGIPESQPLDFHSPYGCSKGAADQYVRDYARIYNLPTVIFRMSCIYGPRQFGTEDQGWLAHFMIAAATGKAITIYGNGKQVRDVLFVDDLVRAFRMAVEKIDTVAGGVFNIGGGPPNAMAVWQEFGAILAELKGEKIPVSYDDWRAGDQPCYVSDVRKAGQRLDWQPLIDKETGVRRLWEWVSSNKSLFETPAKEQQLES
ncbi:MAG: SDR family NAD(P)-dependent oxidoreductase [Gammaproteobacteria bacterium]